MPGFLRLLFTVALASASSLVAAPVYVAIPIGSIGHASSFAVAINDKGVMGGWYYDNNQMEHAFIYDGVVRSLGFPAELRSYSLGINAKGAIAGFVWSASVESRAFVHTDGDATFIGTLGGTRSEARGINASGWVTGRADLSEAGTSHAFVYNGTMVDIDSSGGRYSIGYAINDAGMVTGEVEYPGNGPNAPVGRRAFLYSQGQMKVLGTLGGNGSAGTAINAQGDVVGSSTLAGESPLTRAFLYHGGVMTPIGPAGAYSSFAEGINDRGEVVGTYNAVVDDVLWRSFYHSGGADHDLDALMNPPMPGAQIHYAGGINNLGQIAGVACNATPACFAVRLDPVSITGSASTGVRVTAIEFHHAGFDHYFLSIDPVEIAALDQGRFGGWVRTGESFDLYREPVVGAAPVCRFFSDSFAPKSSHFYTSALAECLGVLANPDWQFEGVRMFAPVPDATGACAAGGAPVFRLYNNGQGGAPAHRYTTSAATQTEMLARGWIREGSGSDGVGLCAAASGP